MNRTAICILIALLLGSPLPGRALHAQIQRAPLPGYPGAPSQNYYQPARICGPEGVRIAFAIDGKFVERQSSPSVVGLLLGDDYRMRITNIPFHPGRELFPSIKVIARTFPPRGQELEFPILIDLTQEDLECALAGKMVTRVIYLEDPKNAIPMRGDLGPQPTTEAVGADNPIDIASVLGQPVAIVRLGGRIPHLAGPDPSFFFGSPSWLAFDRTPNGGFEITLFQNAPRLYIPPPNAAPLLTQPTHSYPPQNIPIPLSPGSGRSTLLGRQPGMILH